MISRKCCSPFLWLAVIAINSVRCPLCQAKAGTGDREARDLSIETYPDMLQSDWSPPKAQYDASHICHRFSDPDYVKREFYSPGFENEKTYRNETDCELVLEAPPGKRLKLDFRDYFEIESSPNCKNDFLEVRDGPRGYSTPIWKFCGSEFPNILSSKDRYLWIHFKSDENIEYRGFKAVFEYLGRPADGLPEILPCNIHLNISEEGALNKSNIPAENTKFVEDNKMDLDCLWTIEVRPEMKIQLQFKSFELDKPNECDNNFVEVYWAKTDESHLKKKFCGSIADTVNGDSNMMFVRFFARYENLKNSKFEANFTAFRELDKQQKQECRPDEFDCEDATCIASSLRCNGRFNCRFRWDEDNCQGASVQSMSLNDDHIIVIMVIFSLILSGMCFTFIFNCVKKLIRDHKTIQDYIRQSREQQLNELDKQEQGEKKMSKSGSRSRSNSSPSINSGHFDVTNAPTTPCYVPGGELLPILIPNERSVSPPNGDTYHRNIYTVDNETMPEMCDSACQTRESLFTTQGYSSGNSTPNHSVHTNSPPVPFSTFGYKKETKFKAEAKIEVAPRKKFEDKRRPYSVQTTKSAPDVIVTH